MSNPEAVADAVADAMGRLELAARCLDEASQRLERVLQHQRGLAVHADITANLAGQARAEKDILGDIVATLLSGPKGTMTYVRRDNELALELEREADAEADAMRAEYAAAADVVDDVLSS